MLVNTNPPYIIKLLYTKIETYRPYHLENTETKPSRDSDHQKFVSKITNIMHIIECDLIYTVTVPLLHNTMQIHQP